MIAEFVGPPGAGKSTHARLLADRLSVPVIDLNGYQALDGSTLTPRQRHIDRFLSMATQPRLASQPIRFALDGGRGLALSWTVNLVRRNRAMRRVPRSAVVEEGPLHALILAMCERPGWFPTIRLVSPDIMVLVEAPPEVVWKRVLGRGGILSDATEEYVVDLVLRYQRSVRVALSSVEVPTLEVDGSKGIEESSEALWRELAPHIQH